MEIYLPNTAFILFMIIFTHVVFLFSQLCVSKLRILIEDSDQNCKTL